MKLNPSMLDSEIALKDINLILRPGSLTIILGRVGQGKTTLLKALMGLLNLEKGAFIV